MIALKWRAVAGKGLPLTGFTIRNYSPELTDRQRQMMAKSLPKKKTLDGVKNVILVASGKGGVGKSTTAVNLAMALSTQGGGKRVGILDADIYGPSIPLMMNLTDQEPPLVTQEQKMVPLQNYGVKCKSFNSNLLSGNRKQNPLFLFSPSQACQWGSFSRKPRTQWYGGVLW